MKAEIKIRQEKLEAKIETLREFRTQLKEVEAPAKCK
jgi:hypothetical protein